MKKSSPWFARHPRLTLFLAAAIGIGVLILVCELLLRLFLPFTYVTIGHTESPHARLYGWGYNPHELARIMNPDTGEVYWDRVNSRGWRDRERTLENTRGSFRIVVIGDSVTFGAIVPAAQIYTRLLEDRLQREGYNVEVINISYGGWDPEQELEALKNEGILYRPDLVILQFCANDLGGPACAPDPAAAAAAADKPKPFYYRFDEAGRLVRMTNDYYFDIYRRSLTNRLKALVSHSELLKRMYYLAVVMKLKNMGVAAATATPRYVITADNLARLQAVFALPANDAALERLRPYVGESVPPGTLREILAGSPRLDDQGKALRMFEDRWFMQGWSPRSFSGATPGVDSCEWRLYFALLQEMADLASSVRADFAVVSEAEAGQYRWEVYWGRLADTERARRNFLSATDHIKNFARGRDIGFIENRREITRARNDPHPDIAGNMALADDLYDYLMEHYGARLPRYRH